MAASEENAQKARLDRVPVQIFGRKTAALNLAIAAQFHDVGHIAALSKRT
jgi:hypothetical protein